MPGTLSKSICDSCHEIGHTWNPSCSGALFDVLLSSFKFSIKIYTTLYSISFLAGRKGIQYFKSRLLVEILQSSLFLSSNAAFYCFFFCQIRRVLGRFYKYSCGLLPGFFASLTAILVERKSRRGVLAIYMLNQACDTMFNMLKDFGYVKDIKYGEVMIFCVTMSILMYMYNSGNLPDGFVKNLLKKCFGNKAENNNNNSGVSGVDSADVKESPAQNITIMKNSLSLGGKMFFIGSSLHTGYYLLTSITKLFKKPKEFFKVALRKENYQFGAWLGSYVGIYDAMVKLLTKYNKTGGDYNAAVAGGVAGVSMLWNRSSTYALYIASKTLELLYMNGIEKNIVPYYKNFDSILYACCTAIMFHSAMLQPLHMKPTYFKFLENLTGDKFITINRKDLDVFGYDSNRINQQALSKTIQTN